jgi:hypothetical protein
LIPSPFRELAMFFLRHTDGAFLGLGDAGGVLLLPPPEYIPLF